MFLKRAHTTGAGSLNKAKIKDYAQFTKLRLASLVVFSASLSYLLAIGSAPIDWLKLILLTTGGFLVTGAANGLNQVLERHHDGVMKRTEDRPLPAGRMTVTEGLIVASVMGVVGIWLLWYFLNPLSGVLGALAVFLYAGVYTPLKRVTPFAVFVGAFPGAIPPMLGYIAETGQFGLMAGLLFAVQFIWQFPHFWAIAWKLHDDYAKAGFSLLPSSGGKDKSSAFQALVYTLFLLPISLLPILLNGNGYIATGMVLLSGIWFLWKAVKLFTSCSDAAATKLMFASFVYLPIVQIAYLIHLI
ncbi:MAG: heme o synthase [Bacteroidota bacterium]